MATEPKKIIPYDEPPGMLLLHVGGWRHSKYWLL